MMLYNVRSRWLVIYQLLYLRVYGTTKLGEVLKLAKKKKKQGQYPAILTEHLGQ